MKKQIGIAVALCIAVVGVAFAQTLPEGMVARGTETKVTNVPTNIVTVANANNQRIGGWIINVSGTETVEVSNVSTFTYGQGHKLLPSGGSVTFNFTTGQHLPVYQGVVYGRGNTNNGTNSVVTRAFTTAAQ